MTDVIAAEVAEAEFERFMDTMDLETDSGDMDEEDRKSFEAAKRKFVRAMQRGQLVVDEKGQPVFTPLSGSTDKITFHEPTGAALMAMDQVKKGHDVQKSFAVMAEITHQNRERFAKMLQRDLKVCQAIFVLFLASR